MCYSVNDETAHIVCSSIYNTHCLLDEQMHYIMQNMRSRLFDRTNTGIGGIFMAKGKISAKQEEILEYIKAQYTSENAGMSSENYVRIIMAERLRF